MRVVSTQLAPITTTLPSTWRSAPVLRSKYWTPFARPLSSTSTRATTAFERISSLPVFSASGQQVIGRAEERRRVATAPTLPAVMACREAVVRDGLDGATNPDERHASAARRRATSRPRRSASSAAAGSTCCPAASRVVVAAADADQLIDLVVVRREVAVVDRPRDVPAVAFACAEVHLAVAQADASPDVGLAAVAPRRESARSRGRPA